MTEFVGVGMIYLCTRFHVLTSNCLLLIAMKLKAIYKFH
jgi:hypothetical protein